MPKVDASDSVKSLPTRTMEKIPKITDTGSGLEKFLISVNSDLAELNNLIDKFNTTHGKPEQIKMLQKIYLQKVKIDNKYSDVDISKCSNYRKEIQQNLFQELKIQFKNLDIASLHNVAKQDPHASSRVKPASGSLPEILANMAPDKATQMLEILAKGKDFQINELVNLYKSTDADFVDYQNFLKNNDITFLGGNNSKNFKITPKDSSPPFVLKVDNRMGMPKSAEAHLSVNSLKDVLTPVRAERQVTGIVQGQTETMILLVTEFCSGGDLESHIKTHRSDEARVKSAISIYSQMATILTGISNDGCAFPDMKNSNWLIDENGKILLADTKSFVFIEENGEFNPTINEDRGYYLLKTGFMSPNEFSRQDTPFLVDKAHSFMLGKNLYHYLSGCDTKYLVNKTNGANYDFRAPIFNTPEGKELEALIKSMIKPNPDNRISMSDALSQLKIISASFNIDAQRNLSTSFKGRLEGIKNDNTAPEIQEKTEPSAHKI